MGEHTDKITGRVKQAAGALTGDADLKRVEVAVTVAPDSNVTPLRNALNIPVPAASVVTSNAPRKVLASP